MMEKDASAYFRIDRAGLILLDVLSQSFQFEYGAGLSIVFPLIISQYVQILENE